MNVEIQARPCAMPGCPAKLQLPDGAARGWYALDVDLKYLGEKSPRFPEQPRHRRVVFCPDHSASLIGLFFS